ncbi:MAG: family 78 glycoside hydrolase catalytic domain [Bacteroidales bacterium]|nr:family 78 glycoside hydrolase catalytic domain [Bacteroidales bacterium]
MKSSGKLLSAVLAGSVLFSIASCGPSFGPYDLKCENLREPLAIDSAEPHFSWKISSPAPMVESAYEIQVASSKKALRKGKADLWDSGKVESSDQIMIPYGGSDLTPKTLSWWRVRVYDSEGNVSKWSEPQRFGTGIFGSTPMEGQYIGASPGEGRSPLLRKSFTLDSRPGTAFLYVNSLGYHEAYINGQKVSEDVLNPAVSQLDKRSLIVTYDVSPLLRKGTNEIILWTGSGWYRKGTFDAEYDGPLVRAELDSVSPDGKQSVILSTDSSWEGTWSGYSDPSSWRFADFGGENIDGRIVPASLSSKDLSSMEWKGVDVVNISGIKASQQMCEPSRVKERLHPQSVKSLGDGKYLADFGKVVNAMFDFTVPGLEAGKEIVVQFSDNLLPDGSLRGMTVMKCLSSGKGTDVFRSRFNHHVFRYVLLEGLDAEPALESMEALRMRTDYDMAASFTSSDKDMNDIHDMIARTLENLAFAGYMVDCASLERLGYGGDGNASTRTLQILADVSPLYMNWLQAWNDSIKEDGGLPHTAPNPYTAGGGPYWCAFIANAPWRTFMNYADSRILERCYPTMRHWLDYVDAYTVNGLLTKWPDQPYRQWFLGDWAAPFGTINVQDPESVSLVANCSILKAYLDLIEIADFLDMDADAEEFLHRYEALAKRINETLFHPETSTYATGSQTDMAFPLLVGIVPDEVKDDVVKALKERTETVFKGHLHTGLVGVPVITEWVTEAGECEWMYSLLKKRDMPGYLYMIDNGATATWEYWSGMRSYMHNCFNGIGSWFYEALGGLTPAEPGYRRVRIEPQIPAGLQSVSITKETPYGKIVENRVGRNLHVELPVGVTAEIFGKEYGCGKHDIEI